MTETIQSAGFDEGFEGFFVQVLVFDAFEEVGNGFEFAILFPLVDDGGGDALAEVFNRYKSEADTVRCDWYRTFDSPRTV